MDYIVYIADECRREAKKHNYEDALDKTASDVERNQSIANFDQFPVPFLVKKKFGAYKGRLIAAEKIVTVNDTDYVVIQFLAVLIRADKEYSDFQKNTKGNADRFLQRVNAEELQKFVEKRIAQDPPPKKQSLSNEEELFLHGSNIPDNFENEQLLYESEDWIKTINSKPYTNYLSAIRNSVEDIVNSKGGGEYHADIKDFPNHYIIFFKDLEKKYTFLAGFCTNEADVEKNREQWKKRMETSDIVKIARRSYPDYLLYDPDLWFEIEHDSQSNFALSGEEINVLKSMSDLNPFPLFINGRAGSGKSTILQYLFAEYFFRYLSYQDVPPPAYFTYNSELLKQAKTFVRSLLKTNSNFAEKMQDKIKIDDEELNQKLDMSFSELQKYLLSIVDDENRFLQDKYVSYSAFTKRWNDKFRADKTARKEYPADISWHVIRTYIEGISPDDYLEPEEYDGLEKDQKTVSVELYQKIYKTVWEWYKKLKEDEGLWDDQDLVRYIIENDIVTSRFSGVFCDESQDFTRIEMEVIYRLSIFSDRDIPLRYVSKIPFAFAGDEFQTINPTGFRWDAITALFTEKFILSVYPNKSRRPKLNFKELKNNYRSTQNIVNFCNALQLFRANRFAIPNLLPQYPWENSDGPSIAHFEPKSAIFWQGIKEKPDSVVFIIPCNEGDEINWIRNDPELNANITIRNEKTPDILVLSANSAKGLEFARVVVWKFGNEPGLDRLINSPESEDAAQLLPLQYHINKTYVAVSRTKSKLYILDDDTGINNLWRVTQNSDLIKSYLSKINEKKEQWNSSHLETYKEGSRLDFSDNVIDNQEETAKQLMEKGLSSKQPYLLGQAARIFAKLNDSQNSAKCKGYVEIFDEKNYFLAGEYFCEGGWTKLAVQAFLLANNLPNDKAGLNKIIEVSASDLTLKDTVSYYVALAFCRTTIESVDALIDLLLKDAPLQFDNYFPHEAMKQIISGILDNGLKQIVDRNQSSESLLEGAVTLYQKKSISIQTEIIALMAFSLSKYKLAVDYWDMSRKRDEEKYKNAQMQLKDFPDNITVLFSGKDYAKIASEYKKYEGKLSDDAMVIVIQALFFENKHEEAFDAVVNIHSAAQLEKITQACSSCFNSKEKEILSVCVRISDIFSESWNKVLRLIDSAKNGDINPFYVAIALARTNGLPSVLPTTQKLISDFLEREFIRKFENIPESLVFDIGTAIEKAGKRNDDALKYYKLAAKRFSGNREKERVCAERWIHAKEMWVQRHKGLDAINHKEDVAEIEEACARYGINKEKINDFIALDGKSSVMRYIIDTETKKVSIKIPRENKKPPITDDDHHVKQKVEVNIDGYELVYFTKIKRLNITSNADGKTISVCHSESKIGTILTQDYTVTDSFTDDIGACQKIEGTPVYFSVTEEKIMVSFEKTKVVVHFS